MRMIKQLFSEVLSLQGDQARRYYDRDIQNIAV